jgi:hypothetical protein
MYGFMNRYFKLGFSEPVLEREFVVPTEAEMSVWTSAHPKPTGDKVGGAHEKTLLKFWSDDSDKHLAGHPELITRAWEIMIGRTIPSADDLQVDKGTSNNRGNYTVHTGTVRDMKDNEDVPYLLAEPTSPKWNGTIALWLSNKGAEGLADGNGPNAAVQKLLDAGIAVGIPSLYLASATEQPMNPVKSRDSKRNEWQWAACYTYGYNPSLVAHRVHDVMTSVAAIQRQQAKSGPVKIILVGTDGAGVVAAAAAAVMKDKFAGAVIDTEGFRFASLQDQWSPLFVPGAVKYGDVPALLKASDSLKPTIFGENGARGGTDAIVAAVLKQAAKGGRAGNSE